MFLLEEINQGPFVTPPTTLVELKSRVFSIERVRQYPNTHFVLIPALVGGVLVLSNVRLFAFAALLLTVYLSTKLRDPVAAGSGNEMVQKIGYLLGVIVTYVYVFYSGLFYVFLQWGYVSMFMVIAHLLVRDTNAVNISEGQLT